MSIVTGGDMLDEILGDINYENNERALGLYPFKVRVGVIKYRPPRHEFFEYILNMGMVDIEKILYDADNYKPASKLTFIFPERWMSVHEQRCFMYELCKVKNVDMIEQVDIITSSPIMVSDFMACMIRIITWPDDEKYEQIGKR